MENIEIFDRLALSPADHDRIAAVIATAPSSATVGGALSDPRALWVALRLDGQVVGCAVATTDDLSSAEEVGHVLVTLLAKAVLRNRQADAAAAALLKQIGGAH
jgi:hypothetical protein